VTLAFAFDLRDANGLLLLPLTAAQILWINLMTDGLPAMALAFDRTPGVMQQPPRPPQAPLLDRPSLRFIVGVGSMKALLALGLLALVPRLGYDLDAARAVTFHFMAVGQLLLTYPSRHTWTRPAPNRYLHAAVLGGLAIQVLAAWLPLTARLLGKTAIPASLWLLVFGTAAVSWALAEWISRAVWRRAWEKSGAVLAAGG
jgi:Ca2+-transporting ATPase